MPFTAFALDSRILEGIRDLGFVETRSIQTAVIPLALQGADLIASAETGSGKTAAFVLPTLQRLLTKPAGAAKSRVLVLAPTRELAVQIEDEIHGLSYHTGVTSAAVYGGVELGIQDMGFWPDVRRIIASLPSSKAGRQTLLFSATMPDEILRDALEITREAKYIQVGQRSAPASAITHRVERVTASHKVEWLIDHLRRPEGPVLVFMRTKVGADRLARKLAAAGIRCAALHADRSQDQRRVAVEGFKGGKYKVLVATDIAARGLDIDAIHTVINYEVPDSPDAYVHRVGRTGRADAVGQAITLVAPEERRALAFLAKSVGVPLQ